MADDEDDPPSRGGIILALILAITAVVAVAVALSTPGAPWAIAAWVIICCALGAWLAPRFPPAGFVLGLGGGFCALIAIFFDALGGRDSASFETVVIGSMVVQGVFGAIWLLIEVGYLIAHRKPLEPLVDHNQALRSVPEARVVRDRRVE